MFIDANNKVRLRGHITQGCELAGKICGEEFYQFTISVTRYSGVADEIPCRITERCEGFNLIKEGAYIEVDGRYASYIQKVKEGVRGKRLLTVFAKKVELSKETTDLNEINLCGEIQSMRPFKQIKTREIQELTLIVGRSYNRFDYIPIVLWGRNANYCRDNWSEGTVLKVKGRIQSRVYKKTMEDGTTEDRVTYEVSVGIAEETTLFKSEETNHVDVETK